MGRTLLDGINGILSSTIIRPLINITTAGSALITKVIAGPGISLSSTGVDSGTGDVTISAATAAITAGTISGATISTSPINSSSIGATTASTGAFTTLSASSTATFGSVVITGGTINGTPIGSNTASTGAFTTLSASALATFSNISVTGGSINGTPIGATTASTGKFTNLTVTNTLTTYGLTSAPITLSVITTPDAPVGTPSTTGGSVPADNYYFKVVATDSRSGATIAGPESAAVTTTGTTSSIALTWTASAGATGYRIYYSNTSGGQNSYYTSSTNSFTLTALSGTTGTPSIINSTSRITSTRITTGVTNSPSTFILGNIDNTLGATVGAYQYIGELQSYTSNYSRLQFAHYRRVASSSWQGTSFRIQYAVDNSFTDGSKSYIELGAGDSSAGGGFIAFGTSGSDRLTIANNGKVSVSSTLDTAALTINSVDITVFVKAILTGLPTTLPGTAGVLWNNNGVISVS